jgi:hypothetical protein
MRTRCLCLLLAMWSTQACGIDHQAEVDAPRDGAGETQSVNMSAKLVPAQDTRNEIALITMEIRNASDTDVCAVEPVPVRRDTVVPELAGYYWAEDQSHDRPISWSASQGESSPVATEVTRVPANEVGRLDIEVPPQEFAVNVQRLEWAVSVIVARCEGIRREADGRHRWYRRDQPLRNAREFVGTSVGSEPILLHEE